MTLIAARRRWLTTSIALVVALTIPWLAAPTRSRAVDGGGTVDAPAGGSVHVDLVTELVNQVVRVSWTGFKPSGETRLTPSTVYPVRVYQCKTAQPAGPQDCYGSQLYGGDGSLPDGPSNHLDSVTAPDGTGGVDIEIRTKRESTTLGCDATTPCSIAVVPNYGDPACGCDNDSAVQGLMDQPYAWAIHATVPLAFAPTAADCPLADADVTSAGAPMAQRAVTSWQPATCNASNAVNVDYTALGEPQARTSFLAGQADIALTTLPADRAGTRALTYAPIAVSSIALAYRVDDIETGQSITDMKLTARLVAKLITESYGYSGYVAPGHPVGTGNPATAGNPACLWQDPEFLALNPGHTWPNVCSTPLLVSDNSDQTEELTRWIDEDAAARAWLDGAADPGGMKVNANFKGIDYPVSSFELRDPYAAFTYIFSPLHGLDAVARGLVTNQPPGVSPFADPITGGHPKPPTEAPGQRDLLAIIDSGNAAAFRFPVAALANASGAYVVPDDLSMTAAVAAMTTNPDGLTHRANFATADAAAYPLTMIHYAMAPISGLPAVKAGQVGLFLDYAIGPGQHSGVASGDLPPGYLPLPPALTAQAQAASTAVKAALGTKKPTPTPTASPTRSPTTTPSPHPTGSLSATGTTTHAPAAGASGSGGGLGGGAAGGGGSGGAAGAPSVTARPAAGAGPRPATRPPGSAAPASPLRPAPARPVSATPAFGLVAAPSDPAPRLVLLVVLLLGMTASVIGPGLLLASQHGARLRALAGRLRSRP